MSTFAGPLIAATIGAWSAYWMSRRALARHGQMTAVKNDLDAADKMPAGPLRDLVVRWAAVRTTAIGLVETGPAYTRSTRILLILSCIAFPAGLALWLYPIGRWAFTGEVGDGVAFGFAWFFVPGIIVTGTEAFGYFRNAREKRQPQLRGVPPEIATALQAQITDIHLGFKALVDEPDEAGEVPDREGPDRRA
ncbi:hypothetical protein HWD35_20685 [Tsukamurella tyrosinosolvens]|uniref:hypothetical protein n=1 Tax=Tsukamurella tyrosinosolvens TaxID=57704 RepID=UPI001CE2027E|nr:hypothetical protein [Tsukamurella tyrosinosolvens]MCA4997142.1 hypothetical protein [Tsukamurella tyrosinosolvens]